MLGIVLLGVVLVLAQTAPEIMATLFRPEFAVAGPVLALLSWSALLAGLGTVYAHLLVAVGRQACCSASTAPERCCRCSCSSR